MTKVSVFKYFTKKVANKDLSEILLEIKNGVYKIQVEDVRNRLEMGDTRGADATKKQLLAFTPSGTFDKGRKIEQVSSYSGYIVLDLDKLNPTQLQEAKQKAINIPFTFAAFISPSGNGLKIIVPVNTTKEKHKNAFLQIAIYYEEALKLSVDPSGKDVSRLCFVSFDPECFINSNPETFNVNSKSIQIESPIVVQSETLRPKKVISFKPNNNESDCQEQFKNCIDFTEKIATYTEGSRNNFVHLLACNCNRVGIPENEAQNLILQQYNLDQKEATSTITSAYKNNIHEHAKFANLAKYEPQPIQSKENLLMDLPFLPDEIFDKLPEILKIGCCVFPDRRERDVFLTGALGILSGCMNNVVGVYRGKEHYANLYVFIIAPAANGKGSMTHAKELGQKYHDKLLAASNDKRKFYEVALQDYKKKMNDKRCKSEDMEIPEEPPFKILYIPANNSSARVIQHLKEGDEQGIFCETEADSMGNVLKQDWGSYSDLLRKAFHHEPISYSRKTGKEFVEIKKPRLAVALAGTPGQVENLIKSAEDGLFSRFIFYSFKSAIAWVDAGETINGFNYTEHFEKLSTQVLNFVEFLETYSKINFKLTLEQWNRLNEFGRNSISYLTTFVSEDLASTSKRLGLILFRLCMILSALKYFDRAEISDEFICADEDFETALQLVNTYQEHAAFMFNELPKNGSVADKLLRKVFDVLPEQFQRKNAIELAISQLDMKERTTDLYLSKLCTVKWLEKTKSGMYQENIKIMTNKLVYYVYLHSFTPNFAIETMASKKNHKVKDNYIFYNELLAKRKSIFSEVIDIKKFGNHPRTLEESVDVTHPDVSDKMVLLVDVKVNNYNFFQFKLRYKEFLDNPIFRFDSDGATHWNQIDGNPLQKQQIPTPHFHKFNENGVEVAYKTDHLQDESKKKALEDIQNCIVHFFHECNIRVNENSFPSIKILSNQLGFSFENEDPNQNILFL